MSIRRAETSDVSAINHLRLQVKENQLSDPNRITEDMTRAAITEIGRGWVYEEDNRLLGFSIANQDDSEIWALFVLPGHEGKGIGQSLISEAVTWLWSLGKQTVFLSTDPNTRAEQFYLRNGWQKNGFKDNGEVKFVLNRN